MSPGARADSLPSWSGHAFLQVTLIPLSENSPIEKIYSVFFRLEYTTDFKPAGGMACSRYHYHLNPFPNDNAKLGCASPLVILFIPGYRFISALFQKKVLSISLSVLHAPHEIFLQGYPWLIRGWISPCGNPAWSDHGIINPFFDGADRYCTFHKTRSSCTMPFSAIAGTIREEILPSGIGRIDWLLKRVLIFGILITLIIAA